MLDPLLDFGEWDVETLRISIFCPSDDVSSTRTGLWAKVTGTKPETIDSRPREDVTKVVGSMGQNNLVLTIQAGRIDWLVLPIVVPPNQRATTLLTLKDVTGLFPVLVNAIRHSLETTSVVLRLAFSSVLIKQVSDPARTIRELSRYLPRLDMDSLEGPDFIYQVNRRRRSASVQHARINRLAKWSATQVAGLEVQVNPTGQPLVRNTNVSFVRKLELDVNTTPETNAMSNDRIPALFAELVTLAGELAIEGDVS